MIWGLGVLGCQLEELAGELGGVHAPPPAFAEEAMLAYYGDEAATLLCRIKLIGRLAAGRPCTDVHHAFMIDLIANIDPAPMFVWLIRHPLACIADMLSRDAWQPGHADTFWRPPRGWPDGTPRFAKAVANWCEVNQMIDYQLAASGAPWKAVIEPPARRFVGRALSAAQQNAIHSVAMPLWDGWKRGYGDDPRAGC